MSIPSEQNRRTTPWKSVSMVLMGILVGCVGSAAINSPSSAYATARPAAFEHMCMGPSMSIDGINDDVTQAGADGWELVTMSDGAVCFKRPVL